MAVKQRNPARVLLVDDDTKLCRSLSRVLEDHEFQVDTANCAAEAQAFLNHYRFDVIVCDHNMPGTSGLDFLTNVRKTKPELITMLLSGELHGLSVAKDWASEIGVTEVFSKPCDANTIALAIRNAIAEQVRLA